MSSTNNIADRLRDLGHEIVGQMDDNEYAEYYGFTLGGVQVGVQDWTLSISNMDGCLTIQTIPGSRDVSGVPSLMRWTANDGGLWDQIVHPEEIRRHRRSQRRHCPQSDQRDRTVGCGGALQL